MTKLSSYATKRRRGLVPFRYNGVARVTPPVSEDEARTHWRAAAIKAADTQKWRKPLTRIVRRRNARGLIPLTSEELRILGAV